MPAPIIAAAISAGGLLGSSAVNAFSGPDTDFLESQAAAEEEMMRRFINLIFGSQFGDGGLVGKSGQIEADQEEALRLLFSSQGQFPGGFSFAREGGVEGIPRHDFSAIFDQGLSTLPEQGDFNRLIQLAGLARPTNSFAAGQLGQLAFQKENALANAIGGGASSFLQSIFLDDIIAEMQQNAITGGRPNVPPGLLNFPNG